MGILPHRLQRMRARKSRRIRRNGTTKGARERQMYRFSRSIYRELAPRVVEDERDPTGCREQAAGPRACEATMRRLACDRRYFARPARALFTEVRMHFAISEQLRVCHGDRPATSSSRSSSSSGCPRSWRSTGSARSAGRTPARARRASASRCRDATTARRTSTSRRPSTGRSSRSRRSRRRSSRSPLAEAIARGARPFGATLNGDEAPARSRGLALRRRRRPLDSFGACCWESTSAGPSPTPSSSTASGLHTAKAPTTPGRPVARA